jgi:hypothetical protein
MHIASALRRKRDEIAATISIHKAWIDAAEREMAALEQAARLFDSEGGGEHTALNREFESIRQREEIIPAQCEVWEPETAPTLGQLALPISGERDFDDQGVESIGVQRPQFAGMAAHPAMHRTGEQVPAEFFYFNWP